MAEWEKQIGAINLIVGDLERSKAFYRGRSLSPVLANGLPAARFEQLFGPERAGREAAHRAAEAARHACQDLGILEVRRRLDDRLRAR